MMISPLEYIRTSTQWNKTITAILYAIIFAYGYSSRQGFGQINFILCATGVAAIFLSATKFSTNRVIKIFFTLWLIYAIIITITKTYHNEPFKEFGEGITSFLLAYLIYNGIRWIKPSISNLSLGLAMASLYSGAISIYELTTANTNIRVEGPYKLALQWGQVSVMAAILCMILAIHYLNSKKTQYGILLVLISIGGIIASFLTGSKSTWLSVFLIWTPLLVAAFLKMQRTQKIVCGFILILVGTLLITHPLSPVSNRVTQLDTFLSQKQSDRSIAPRIGMLFYGTQKIKENPWLGSGRKEIENDLEMIANTGEMPRFISDIHTHLHNEILDMTVELGLISSLSFLIPLVILFRYFLNTIKSTNEKQNNTQRTGALMGMSILVSYFLFSTSDRFLVYSATRDSFMFYLLISIWLTSNSDQIKSTPSSPKFA